MSLQVLDGENEGKIEVVRVCPICNETEQRVTVSRQGYITWRRGVLIQDALPELTPDQREVLLSGICETCWEESF